MAIVPVASLVALTLAGKMALVMDMVLNMAMALVLVLLMAVDMRKFG
jgi:hypothetical protein